MNDLLQTIESDDFQQQFSVLSGFSTMYAAFEVDNAVEALTEMAEDLAVQLTIAQRILALVSVSNGEHLHPHDIAVAAYFYALQVSDDVVLVQKLAQKVAETQRFWWANKMAQRVLDNLQQTADTQDKAS